MFLLLWRPAGKALTGDLHHTVLGLHHQLLGGEVIDVQAHLPAVRRLLDLRHARAHLPRHAHVGAHHGAHELRPHVARPVAGGGEGGHLLAQGGHAKGLVEDAAALVVLAEGVPAGGPQQGEWNASLRHGCCWWF
uniref:Uncharacterized protein n=1 Tax=Gadus morhua TaxID=8049 RepID=A0A8C4ZEL3_GADMO